MKRITEDGESDSIIWVYISSEALQTQQAYDGESTFTRG